MTNAAPAAVAPAGPSHQTDLTDDDLRALDLDRLIDALAASLDAGEVAR